MQPRVYHQVRAVDVDKRPRADKIAEVFFVFGAQDLIGTVVLTWANAKQCREQVQFVISEYHSNAISVLVGKPQHTC